MARIKTRQQLADSEEQAMWTVIQALQQALVELESFVPFTNIKVIEGVKNALQILR